LRQTLEAVLELVVERVGDPAPRVYEQLFAADRTRTVWHANLERVNRITAACAGGT